MGTRERADRGNRDDNRSKDNRHGRTRKSNNEETKLRGKRERIKDDLTWNKRKMQFSLQELLQREERSSR